MLKIRDLEPRDKDGLSSFVTEIYKEYPTSMWFESEPTPVMLSKLFAHKLSSMLEKNIVDVVAVEGRDDGTDAILGELEIARLAGPVGYIGIIIKKDRRGNGLGSILLERACAQASLLGITDLRAEIAEENIAARKLFEKYGFLLESGEAKNGPTGSKVVLYRRIMK
jgi:RimJ/RimL family protein N-acetyltransferase